MAVLHRKIRRFTVTTVIAFRCTGVQLDPTLQRHFPTVEMQLVNRTTRAQDCGLKAPLSFLRRLGPTLRLTRTGSKIRIDSGSVTTPGNGYAIFFTPGYVDGTVVYVKGSYATVSGGKAIHNGATGTNYVVQ